MKFDVIKFYKDYNVPHATEGTKHTRSGWVNARCPFCASGSSSLHLGIHIDGGAVKCWKCGTHSQLDVVRKITNSDWHRAKEIHESYSTGTRTRTAKGKAKEGVRKANRCTLPPSTGELTPRHRKYLEGRNFDPDKLVKLWGLKGTSEFGRYKWRIIIPITFDNVLVSYQGRDITNKSPLKYKACNKADEVMDHQTILYGMDKADGDSCVVVEGAADCWRLGYGAVSCFGTAFTMEQVNLLASRYKKIYILFDGNEEDAADAAQRLGVLLSARGRYVEILELEDGDPGDMNQQDADELMKELMI